MIYTPLATDAHGGLCPMPYALGPREHLMFLRKAILTVISTAKMLRTLLIVEILAWIVFCRRSPAITVTTYQKYFD